MELYIFNGADRQLSGIIEAYEYLRWTRRYSQCGSFELKALVTPENIALLKEGNILWKNECGGAPPDEEAGIIERVELSQIDREIITVNGRFATSFLARRIVWGTEILSGDLSACVGQLLERNFLNPSDTDRKITDFDYSAPTLGVNISSQVSHRNLLEAVTELCDTAETGIKTTFNPRTGLFTVALYSGGASDAVFSKEYENLTGQTYTENVDTYANTALIGGEGEGADRAFVTITQGFGENRREVFVDAKDLRAEDFPDYTAALLFRGQSKLTELAPHYSFDADVNPHGNLRYKMDFDLGQTVKVISKLWGVSMTARITEIEETYDASGQSLTLTFGKSELTLAQKMRSDMSGMKTALLAMPSGGSGEIPDASVTSAKIADNAVTGTKIASGAVASTEIAVNAVTSEKIANSAVTADKIASSSVGTVKIADSAITAAKIAAGAIAASELASNAVTAVKIASGTVTMAKIAPAPDTAMTYTVASGVTVNMINCACYNTVVHLYIRVYITTAVASGGTILTITDSNFYPPVALSFTAAAMSATVAGFRVNISTSGVMTNGNSGATGLGYFDITATYSRRN